MEFWSDAPATPTAFTKVSAVKGFGGRRMGQWGNDRMIK